MTPYDVAREAQRLALIPHLSFRVDVERARDGISGQTYAWVSNGYGVSLIPHPRDTYPEILVCRKGDASWGMTRPLTAHIGNRTIRTDPVGNLRSVTPDMLCAFLGELAWWNEGRDWRHPVVGSTG